MTPENSGLRQFLLPEFEELARGIVVDGVPSAGNRG